MEYRSCPPQALPQHFPSPCVGQRRDFDVFWAPQADFSPLRGALNVFYLLQYIFSMKNPVKITLTFCPVRMLFFFKSPVNLGPPTTYHNQRTSRLFKILKGGPFTPDLWIPKFSRLRRGTLHKTFLAKCFHSQTKFDFLWSNRNTSGQLEISEWVDFAWVVKWLDLCEDLVESFRSKSYVEIPYPSNKKWEVKSVRPLWLLPPLHCFPRKLKRLKITGSGEVLLRDEKSSLTHFRCIFRDFMIVMKIL